MDDGFVHRWFPHDKRVGGVQDRMIRSTRHPRSFDRDRTIVGSGKYVLPEGMGSACARQNTCFNRRVGQNVPDRVRPGSQFVQRGSEKPSEQSFGLQDVSQFTSPVRGSEHHKAPQLMGWICHKGKPNQNATERMGDQMNGAFGMFTGFSDDRFHKLFSQCLTVVLTGPVGYGPGLITVVPKSTRKRHHTQTRPGQSMEEKDDSPM